MFAWLFGLTVPTFDTLLSPLTGLVRNLRLAIISPLQELIALHRGKQAVARSVHSTVSRQIQNHASRAFPQPGRSIPQLAFLYRHWSTFPLVGSVVVDT